MTINNILNFFHHIKKPKKENLEPISMTPNPDFFDKKLEERIKENIKKNIEENKNKVGIILDVKI